MSRVGKQPISLPEEVEVKIEGTKVMIRGPKGELVEEFPSQIKITKKDNQIIVERYSEEKRDRALHGLSRALLQNMVLGVTQGFKKGLEIVGVGYKAVKKGEKLEIQVGYSNPVIISPKKGIEFEVPVPTKIIVKGIDKQLVGEMAAEIRVIRKPEPYKGKGIRYENEYVRRKAGKTAK